jgi:hypothetical protein
MKFFSGSLFVRLEITETLFLYHDSAVTANIFSILPFVSSVPLSFNRSNISQTRTIRGEPVTGFLAG